MGSLVPFVSLGSNNKGELAFKRQIRGKKFSTRAACLHKARGMRYFWCAMRLTLVGLTQLRSSEMDDSAVVRNVARASLLQTASHMKSRLQINPSRARKRRVL